MTVSASSRFLVLVLTASLRTSAAQATMEGTSHVARYLASADEILLEDFANPIHQWDTMNDPVMGGQSTSKLVVENGIAHFTGVCAIVPFLHAPGFITMVTGGFYGGPETFPDVSSCKALALTLKTNTPDYTGYRVSFGKEHLPEGRHAEGYKAPPLTNLPSDDFGEVVIPFHQFSSKWDDATGDVTVTCAENPKYCPSKKWLRNMKTISLWGEGVEGKVDLEIRQIRAVGCAFPLHESTTLTAAAAVSPSRLSGGGGFVMLGLMALVGIVVARQRQRQHSVYEEIPLEAAATAVPATQELA